MLQEALNASDYVIPLFTGLKGVYLLQNLLSFYVFSKSNLLRVESALLSFFPSNSRFFAEEISFKTMFEHLEPQFPTVRYVLMSNKIPKYLAEKGIPKLLGGVIIQPFDLFNLIVNKIRLGDNKISGGVVLNEFLSGKETAEALRYLENLHGTQSAFSKLSDLINPAPTEETLYIKALMDFLIRLNSGEIAKIFFIKEEENIHNK